jgi:hypothetical protein
MRQGGFLSLGWAGMSVIAMPVIDTHRPDGNAPEGGRNPPTAHADEIDDAPRALLWRKPGEA